VALDLHAVALADQAGEAVQVVAADPAGDVVALPRRQLITC
jgi:hypothetical protein